MAVFKRVKSLAEAVKYVHTLPIDEVQCYVYVIGRDNFIISESNITLTSGVNLGMIIRDGDNSKLEYALSRYRERVAADEESDAAFCYHCGCRVTNDLGYYFKGCGKEHTDNADEPAVYFCDDHGMLDSDFGTITYKRLAREMQDICVNQCEKKHCDTCTWNDTINRIPSLFLDDFLMKEEAKHE